MNQPLPGASLLASAHNEIALLKLEFALHSHNLELAPFSGNLWRSALGARLAKSFPSVFQSLYGNEQQPGRLYAIAPPSGPVAAGEDFQLGLTLIGPACQFAVACIQAIAGIAESGIGERRQRFFVRQVRQLPDGAPIWQAGSGLTGWPQARPLSAYLQPEMPPLPAGDGQLRVDFLTPLSIKHNNQDYFGEISYPMLLARCYGRLAQLAQETGAAHPLSASAYRDLLAASAGVSHHAAAPLTAHETRRTSARSGQRMRFPGIQGSMHYHGPVAPGLPLLRLAQAVQLGRKTTFGFGCINLQINSPDH